jgi:enamine deaminase RidA (YjgF/YER057c/UK114 family)
MNKQFVSPASLAKPSGYTPGLLTTGGRLLFLAGQTGMDASGVITSPGDIAAQFSQALVNLRAVVTEAGGQMTDIVKLTIFVTDKATYRAQLEPIGAAYRAVFGKYFPAITLVEVRSLYDDQALVEIDGMAVLPEPAA